MAIIVGAGNDNWINNGVDYNPNYAGEVAIGVSGKPEVATG